MATASGVSRWTRRFVVASAVGMVVLQVAFLSRVSLRATALVGLFGAVLPMVFGMAYLLLPSYVGRTLSTRRLPGVHFALAYAGAGLLVGDAVFGFGGAVPGAVLWSAGVAVFVGTLLRTVLPALSERSDGGPRRTPRLVGAALSTAVGYLVAGTLALLSMTAAVPNPVGATLPVVVHLYAVGFVALLIFALGLRLLSGFFHVTPPTPLSWLVLLCGAAAPAVLVTRFGRPPWFLVGAGLALVAMAGYAALVAVVAFRTERRRVGLYGIALGALAGLVAVSVAAAGAVGVGVPATAVHVPVVLDGFLLLTVVGYAYQFFPVTNGQFRGATRRTALATVLSLGVGVALQAVGAASAVRWLGTLGAAFAAVGTAGYAYLVGRRLWT